MCMYNKNSNRPLCSIFIIHIAMLLIGGEYIFKTKSPSWTEHRLRQGDSAISELVFTIFRAGKGEAGDTEVVRSVAQGGL